MPDYKMIALVEVAFDWHTNASSLIDKQKRVAISDKGSTGQTTSVNKPSTKKILVLHLWNMSSFDKIFYIKNNGNKSIDLAT